MSKPNDLCIVCGDGHYRAFLKDMEIETQEGTRVCVPEVTMLRCDACGDEIVPPASHNFVDRYVADAAEQLSRQDVQMVFDRIGRSQASVAEELGFGSKTLSRWLSGSQHPNRAMGFYLRAMAQFPHVYSWIQRRAWKTSRQGGSAERTKPPTVSFQYTDLEEAQVESACDSGVNFAASFRNSIYSADAA